MFSSVIIYLGLFLALFFLPGFFTAVMLGIRKFRFLLSFALSYSLLVLTLLPCKYYALPIARWQWCFFALWAILAAGALARTIVKLNSNRSVKPQAAGNGSGARTGGRGPGGKSFMRRRAFSRAAIPLALAGIICGYLLYAGVYLEIPSDALTHIERFQAQKLMVVDKGAFSGNPSFSSVFLVQGQHWYFLHAWLCLVSGLAIMDSLRALTFANVIVFLLGIYYFALYLFAGLRLSSFKKMMMAAAASLFAAVTTGNAVFAYIRYYTFGPTILNYVLFLAAMAAIMAWLKSNYWFGGERQGRFGHALWIAPVLLIVTNAVHTQEALFIFFMTLALSLTKTAVSLRNKPVNFRGCRGPLARPRGWTTGEWKTAIMAAVLLIVFFAGFAVIRDCRPGPWVSDRTILPHINVPSEPVNFIFRSALISPPQNPYLRLAAYQLFLFYQVIGCWGLFVYLLFFLAIRRFVKLPYLLAGMIVVPWLTIFNPLTIDLIVRIRQAMALYRFIYLIPLPFVGGYFLVYFLGKAREYARGTPRTAWLKFAGCILIIAGLVGLVFPVNAAGVYAPYSKVYTLRKIPVNNDYLAWEDLGRALAEYENKVILTDKISARFLWCYAPKNTCRPVEWLHSSKPAAEEPRPYTWEKLRGRGLIVINRRWGGLSATGRIARHWPEDFPVKMSRCYSAETQNYLEANPEKFRKIWSRNRIAVYAVQ
ncbi:MAG: hypothetical protein PHP98_04565 [Kiritimatiellae bacterium]|nr:hypothetical protein [Kiritimatiellia bacterium]